MRALEVVGVVARALAPLAAVFEVDGLRVRLVVAAGAGAPVFVLLDWVGAAAEERRLGLVGDFGLVLEDVVVFALFASRAGVVEVRFVLGADLAAVFSDVRLGLDATVLAGWLLASFVVAGLAVRVVLVLSDLAGEVSVRLMGDFARDALGAAGLFASLLGRRAFEGSFAAGFEAGFWDASSEAGAAEPLDAGCASCCADAGAFSAFVVVSLLPSSAAALASCLWGDACCSSVVAIPGPFPVGEGSTGLFWLPSVSRSSELKLLMRAGDARPSLWPLTVRDWAALSTATKLARTLESGLAELDLSDPTGDLPRDGGEGVLLLLFWLLLFSNLASRLRTPGLPEAMIVVGYAMGG